MNGFKEYMTFSEIADNYGLEPVKQNLSYIYTKYKQPLSGVVDNSDKPPTASMRKKPTKKDIFKFG